MLKNLSDNKQKISDHFDDKAVLTGEYSKRSKYHKDFIINYLKFYIPDNSKILDIGCGCGYMLDGLKTCAGAGIDISAKMIEHAKSEYKDLKFYNMDAENIDIEETFDHVIISGILSYSEDIQLLFGNLRKISNSGTRFYLIRNSNAWQAVFNFFEMIKIKKPDAKLNGLKKKDIKNLLDIEGFEILRQSKRFIFPFKIPFVSFIINNILFKLPLLNRLCVSECLIFKKSERRAIGGIYGSSSIIVPVKDSKDNIEKIINMIPETGCSTEIIFADIASTDGTSDEIQKAVKKHRSKFEIVHLKQNTPDYYNAVKNSAGIASNEIIIFLNPRIKACKSDIIKLFDAISQGAADIAYASGLIYPDPDGKIKFIQSIFNFILSKMIYAVNGIKFRNPSAMTFALSKKNAERIFSDRQFFGKADKKGSFDLIFGPARLCLKAADIPVRISQNGSIVFKGFINMIRFKITFLKLLFKTKFF